MGFNYGTSKMAVKTMLLVKEEDVIKWSVQSSQKDSANKQMEKGEEGKDSQYFLSREPPYKGPAERVNNGSIKWRVAVCERPTTKEQHICVSPVFFFFFILFVFFFLTDLSETVVVVLLHKWASGLSGRKTRIGKKKRGGPNGRAGPVSQSPHHQNKSESSR